MQVQLHAFFNSTADENEQSTPRAGCSTSGEKSLRYAFEYLGVPDALEKRQILCIMPLSVIERFLRGRGRVDAQTKAESKCLQVGNSVNNKRVSFYTPAPPDRLTTFRLTVK